MPIYVDPTVADNSGDGSQAQPKKYIDSVLRVLKFATDKNVLMRGGYCHSVEPGTTWNTGLDVTNATIGAYWLPGDEPGNPMIDGINWLAPGAKTWTLEGPADAGGFVWSVQLGTANDVKRVWAGSANTGMRLSQRTMGDALRRTPDDNRFGIPVTTDTIASIKATLNVNDAWYGAGSALTYKLYMWTSDDRDPATYYGGLAIAQSGTDTVGIGSMFSIFTTKKLAVSDIDMRGATAWPVQITVTDSPAVACEDITFTRCKAYGSIQGFRVSQNSTLAYNTVVRRITFRECVADTLTCAREQEPGQAYTRFSAQDQYFIGGRVLGVQFVDCVSINPGHAAISIGAWDAIGARPIQSGYLRHRVEVADFCTYARSLNMAGCESSCYIQNCTFIGTNVVGQIAGSGRVTGNKFFGLRKAIRKPSNATQATDGWLSVTCYRTVSGNGSVGNDNVLDLRPENLLIANNSCSGSYGTPLEVDLFIADAGRPAKPVPLTIPDGAFIFQNNIIIDTVPGREGKPYMTTYNDNGMSLGTQIFRSNLIYNGTGKPSSAKWGATTYPSLHSAPGHIGNLTLDPKVDKNLIPMEDSPLIRAGRFCGTTVDFTGKRFGLKPTIGAHEVTAPVVRKPRLP